MAYFYDDRGQLREGDEETAKKLGFRPATDEELDAHNHALDVEESGGSVLGAVGHGFQRGIGAGIDLADKAVQAVAPGFGQSPEGLVDEAGSGAGKGGSGAFPSAYDAQAKLETEAHPIAAGLGTSLAAAIPAAAAGALAPAGAAILGTGIGTIGAESAVQAVAQEYDDSWLQDRPMDLKNVAAYTLMFGGMDLGFRALGKGVMSVLGKETPEPKLSLGSSNVVSEAQDAARNIVPERAAGGSVGAARASDLSEPFDDAIRGMSDRDAAVLARDSEDHLHLTAQSSADAFTRINQGLSDDLGNKLKYQDFAAHAQEWQPKTLEKQSSAINDVLDQAQGAAAEIGRFTEGDKGALDFGNLGKKAVQDINQFGRAISDEADPARRMMLIDEMKKRGDRLMMSVDASYGVDKITTEGLKEIIRPLYGADGALRKMLENGKLFPGAAELQKSLNAPWHNMLKHWPEVQKSVLKATGNVAFDTSGAGRIEKESTVDMMRALLGKDPRSLKEYGKHLKGALDSIGDLVEAREAHGVVGKGGLDEMRSALMNATEDWNLATTIGVAKNRVANMARDPRKWGKLLLNIGERAPFGVGQVVTAARNIGDALGDLHLSKDGALGKVWDQAFQRYAQHPDLADPSIAANYSDWVRDALANRGGAVAPVPPGGGGGMSAGGMVDAGASAANQTAPSQAYQDAMAAVAKRKATGGSVTIIGGPGKITHGAKAGLREAQMAAETEVAGKTLTQLGALEGVNRSNVDWLKADPHFQKTGNLKDKFASAPGGLPSFLIDTDGTMKLRNGRHRLTAAKEMGRETIEGIITKYGPRGGEKWRYQGPIRISDAAESGHVRTGVGAKDLLTSPMAVGTAVGAGGLALAATRDRPPPPDEGPTTAYRGALREIAAGGQKQIQTLASDVIKAKPAKRGDVLSAFVGKGDPTEAVEKLRSSIQQVTADPTALIGQMSGSTGDLSRTHPSVYMALTQKAAQVTQYLKSIIPPRQGTSLLDPQGAPVSLDQAFDVASRYLGAARPKQTMRDIGRTTATPEQVQAFQQNWPELWTPLQIETIGQVQRMHAAGRHIDSEKLRRLDTLLQLNGQLDPSASESVTSTMLQAQDQAAPPIQPPGAGSSPSGAGSGIASSLRTQLGSVQADKGM